MSVLTNLGATFIMQQLVEYITDQTPDGQFYLAVGSGDIAWDSANPIPEPAQTDTGLVAHIGHFVASYKYVIPDENGSIATSANRRWSPSGVPTRHLHLTANIGFNDEPNEVFRETAIYIDALPDTGHENQTYLPAADLSSLGQILNIARRSPLFRSASDLGIINHVYTIGNLE